MKGPFRSFVGAALVAASLGAACDDEAPASDTQFVATKPPRAWEVEPVREGNLRVATFNIRNFPDETFGWGGAGPGGSGPGGAASASASTSTGSASSGVGGAGGGGTDGGGAGGGGADGAGAGGAEPSVPALDATDQAMLLDVLERLDFDLLAVQEIRDPASLDAVLRRLEARTGRTYASAYSDNAQSGNDQQVGLVVDAASLTLSDAKEHASIDVTGTLRAGLSARVASTRPGGVDLSVLVLHLASGESVKRANLRAQQAVAASAVGAELTSAWSDSDVLVLGDLNTAREEAEYAALDAAFASSLPLGRHDNASGCTSYYIKNKLGTLAPSTIDQVYSSSLDEIDATVPLVSGAHCYERSCMAFESDGRETGTTYWGVSDHCPVYFEIRDVDVDG